MKNLFTTLTTSILSLGLATSAMAQAVPAANDDDEIPAAVVTGGAGTGAGVLGATGLSTGATVGLIGAGAVLAIALGSSSTATTTTSP